MTVEIVGLICILLGAIALFQNPRVAIAMLIVATPFGTAAAFNLPAFGGASIIAVNLIAVTVVVRISLWAGPMSLAQPLARNAAGVFLLLLLIYALWSAYFLPRIFSGATNTVSVTETTTGLRVIRFVPLFPSSSNITQAVYFLFGVAGFCATVVFLRRTRDFGFVLSALIAAGVVHLAATAIDMVTYWSGTASFLDPVRNANFAYHCAQEKGGLKRLCGFMSEASAYGIFTLALFAFFVNLWIDRVRTTVTGALALGLFAGIVLSTSGSGYVGLAVFLVFLLLGRGLHIFGSPPFRRTGELVLFALTAIALAALAIAMIPGLSDLLMGFLDETVLGKLESASGRERTMWNQSALQNFYDTKMLGAGLGSARASSMVFVVLSNVGIIGTAFLVLHLYYLLSSRLEAGLSREQHAIVVAARWAVVAYLVTATLIKGNFAFPLLFHIFSGIAVASAVPFLARTSRLGAMHPGPAQRRRA